MRATCNVRVLASCTVSGFALSGLVVLLAYAAITFPGVWRVLASLSLLALITTLGAVLIPLGREQYRGRRARTNDERLMAALPCPACGTLFGPAAARRAYQPEPLLIGQPTDLSGCCDFKCPRCGAAMLPQTV